MDRTCTVSLCSFNPILASVFQSNSFMLNDTQLSTIPLDEAKMESETQFQAHSAAEAAQHVQG